MNFKFLTLWNFSHFECSTLSAVKR